MFPEPRWPLVIHFVGRAPVEVWVRASHIHISGHAKVHDRMSSRAIEFGIEDFAVTAYIGDRAAHDLLLLQYTRTRSPPVFHPNIVNHENARSPDS